MSLPFYGSFLISFGQNIAVLGFAFKADTGDTRESAAITLIRDFLSERARVTIFDPQVEESQIWFDLSEALPDVPLEQSSHSLFFSLGPLDLTHLLPQSRNRSPSPKLRFRPRKTARPSSLQRNWRNSVTSTGAPCTRR